MTNELTLENIRSGAFPSDAHAVGFLLGEIEWLQMRLKRHEPVNLYNGHDIDWWKAEAERLRDALKRVRRVAAEGTTHTGMIAALGILVDRALNPGNGPLPPDYTHHSHEPCEQRNEVNSIDDVAAICHSVTGLCCHILGSPGGPCTIGNCAAVRGYLGGPEFAHGASRDASSEPKCGLCGKPGITEFVRTCCAEGRARDLATARTAKRTFEQRSGEE